MIDGIIIGFLIGVLVGGLYVSWLIKTMKKSGYVKFDVTQKFKEEMK